jgi:hypothetical protein
VPAHLHSIFLFNLARKKYQNQIKFLTFHFISGIPKFETFAEHRGHILIHTAAVFRDFARKGFTEGMSGHISVRDPQYGDYIWMNPLGRHFGLMTAGDMICLDLRTGAVVGGNKVRLPVRAQRLL